MKTYDSDLSLIEAPLGKKSSYLNTYTPSLLFPVPRKLKRDELALSENLPFSGFDIWNGFELSWLNLKGKPIVAIAEFRIPCESQNLIESKSFKLYLNSFNNSCFESFRQVQSVLENDLSKCAGAKVEVTLCKLNETPITLGTLAGICLDDLDIACSEYQPQVDFLTVCGELIEEAVHTNLLKSNCLVTGQPDWGSIQIEYCGNRIHHEGLLKYIVSLRDHNEFHEQCVERIFMDIQTKCNPRWLNVYARYTRRGGLDINPYRTSRVSSKDVKNLRLVRQ